MCEKRCLYSAIILMVTVNVAWCEDTPTAPPTTLAAIQTPRVTALDADNSTFYNSSFSAEPDAAGQQEPHVSNPTRPTRSPDVTSTFPPLVHDPDKHVNLTEGKTGGKAVSVRFLGDLLLVVCSVLLGRNL